MCWSSALKSIIFIPCKSFYHENGVEFHQKTNANICISLTSMESDILLVFISVFTFSYTMKILFSFFANRFEKRHLKQTDRHTKAVCWSYASKEPKLKIQTNFYPIVSLLNQSHARQAQHGTWCQSTSFVCILEIFYTNTFINPAMPRLSVNQNQKNTKSLQNPNLIYFSDTSI